MGYEKVMSSAVKRIVMNIHSFLKEPIIRPKKKITRTTHKAKK